MSFEDFLFLALAAILFNGVELLQPSWIFDQQNFSSFQSRCHPVAKEEVLAQSDLRFGKRCQKLIFKMAAVVATLDFLSTHLAILYLIIKHPNAHHQVLIQLDYKGNIQIMNSQHFSHINV